MKEKTEDRQMIDKKLKYFLLRNRFNNKHARPVLNNFNLIL